MQVNTKIQNPTNFFFNESGDKDTEDYSAQINEFTKKLINTDTCVLCKQKFNFTNNIPRILIHCGHTFCTDCLRNFHKNGRVRCPMCLKLVKQIDSIERLPVNHTIFTKLASEYNHTCRQFGGETIDSKAALYEWFETSSNDQKRQQQQQQQQAQNYMNGPEIGPDGQMIKMPTRIDEESGLEWCEYHYDRIKHFLCLTHKETCCRACVDLFHNMPDCQIMELYDEQDMHGFLKQFFAKNTQNAYYQQSNGIAQQNGNHKIAAAGAAAASPLLAEQSPMYAESSLKEIPAANFTMADHVEYSKFKDLPQGCVNLPQEYSFKDDEDDEEFEDDEDEFEDDQDNEEDAE